MTENRLINSYPVHETLPEGFMFADVLQIESFMNTSSVPGASKVCLVAGAGELPRLACRLRPPRDRGVKYISDYRAGWTLGKKNMGKADGNAAFNDGWLDAVWDRMKWHLAYCSDHHQTRGCRKKG